MYTRKGVIRSLSILFSVGLLCVALAPKARASEWNQRTIVHFNAPVEIPGRVLLPGTYSFQLMSSIANRNIVEIFNKNRTKLYAIVQTAAAYRMNPTGRAVLTLKERPGDSPMAIHKWFYPGMYYGQDFIYPNSARGPRETEMAMVHMARRWGKPGARANS